MKRTIFFTFLSFFLLVSCKQEISFNITTSVQPNNGGSIIITPSSGSVLEGTSVSFTANPNGEYIFTGWSGSISGTENPKTVTVTSDLNVIANFELKTYPLIVYIEGEGVVNERVISTKTDYGVGTVVELTATPASGWSFSHWEGDLTGNTNPEQITVLGDKSVKAVFTKNKYSYNLKIVGPGVVDEYLVKETKTTLDYGTTVLLKAFPADGAVFKGWSGDLTGTDTEVFVNMDDIKDITATFERNVRTYPLPDLMQPSIKLKNLYYGTDFTFLTFHPAGFFPCDYNRDGFVDVLGFGWDIDVCSPIEFYLGAPGGFIVDDKNHQKHMGQTACSKTLMGDFNLDGWPDYFFIGASYDIPEAEGEYNILLLSDGNGGYTENRLEQYIGRYTSGGSADFDNDGDLDILAIDPSYNNSLLLINDGNGGFTNDSEWLDLEMLEGKYHCDVFDIDKDGFGDLILGHTDTQSWEESIVVWGNGESFKGETTTLPKSEVVGMGLIIDNYFYDIDGDGLDELIRIRTGDPVFGTNYTGWAIQVIKFIGRAALDITASVININDSYDFESVHYVALIDIEEIENHIYLVGRKIVNAELLFELTESRFVRVKSSAPEIITYQHGISLKSDVVSFHDWQQWDGYSYVFNNSVRNGCNLSSLVQNGYALEFYIRNEDPTLTIDIKFGSEINRDSWTWATYFAQYRGDEHGADGDWEHITIPLREFDEWSDKKENYWSMIDNLHFQISSTGGLPFSLKDIRIRKVIDTV